MDKLMNRMVGSKILSKFAVLCGERIRRPQNLLTDNHPQGEPSIFNPNNEPVDLGIEGPDRAGDIVMVPIQVWANDGDLIDLPSPQTVQSPPVSHMSDQRVSTRSEENPYHRSVVPMVGVEDVPGPPLEAYRPFAKLPVTAEDPEGIIYISEEGEERGAVALTESALYLWNIVIPLEEKIASNKYDLGHITSHLAKVTAEFNRLDKATDNLPTEGTEGFDSREFLRQGVAQMEILYNEMTDLEKEKNKLTAEIDEYERELSQPKEALYEEWKEILVKYDLLEAERPSDAVPTESQFAYEQNRQEDVMVGLEIEECTPSEAERVELENEKERAIENIIECKRTLHRFQRKLDSWEDYYDHEYQHHRSKFGKGEMDNKSVFDNNMLQEHRNLFQEFQKAEEALEAARQHAKDLGLTLYSQSQESGFLDRADDGYRESLEAQVVAQFDHERIERWMRTETSEKSVDYDDWSAKDVDFSESVTGVAVGKDRRRIDQWRSLCDQLVVENPEPIEEVSE
ncbi:hypothetical protein PVAG01_07095 [Phlyctema vagabunda]|uniref:Uncharacterized protein n=1 Tax=Phlyctema vagabunda TaxID=108571 RepID=A0ABR4PBI4_9HELO